MTAKSPARPRADARVHWTPRGFLREETGSTTVEAVIWFPIFAILLGIMMNISMVFFNESQMMRVVQDGNRMFSLGRLDDAEAVETYVLNNLAYLGSGFLVNSNIANGLIETSLSVPASDLMPLNFMTKAFKEISVGVTAQHIIEF